MIRCTFGQDSMRELELRLGSGEPFVAVMKPGEGFLSFYPAEGDVRLSPWPGCTFPMQVCRRSTPRDYYMESIGELAGRLAVDRCKTVICRTICGQWKVFSPGAVAAMAHDYFNRLGGSFRFFFHMPEAGYWMGATPELLAERMDGRLHTIALAGSMAADSAASWSQKNIDEHNYVVEDISERIAAGGFALETGERRELCYSNAVKHLCTDIYAVAMDGERELSVADFAAGLHPTPAVAGWPRGKAMREIAEYELCPRNFYGGVICNNREGYAYVMLRCMHFDETGWCVYSGGGITGASLPEEEWEETQSKAKTLLSVLEDYSL